MSASERERGIAHLTFALADGMDLPFRDGTFDMVLSHAVIEHVADAPKYLRECARVLALAATCTCRPRRTCRSRARTCRG